MHLILASESKNEMTNISFLIVICVGPLYATVYSMSDIQYVQPNGFSSNSALSGSMLWSSNVTSTIRCSQLCQNDDRCISFNTKKLAYHKFLCELNWQYETNSTSLQQCDNCNYYYQVHNNTALNRSFIFHLII